MMFKNKTLNLVWELACALVLIAFYGKFAYTFGTRFFETYSLSVLIFFIYEMMLVFMVVIRNMPTKVSTSFYDWSVALAGTLLPLVMVPLVQPNDYTVLIVIQMAGLIVSAIGLASLFRSFGVVAANRGIKTTGFFAYIRHPLYSGYFFSITSFLIQNFNLYNFAVYAAFIAFKVMRIYAEEKLLLEDPEYQAYAEKVKWRIIPGIW